VPKILAADTCINAYTIGYTDVSANAYYILYKDYSINAYNPGYIEASINAITLAFSIHLSMPTTLAI
jgi:hypothetical protein